MQIGMIGLGRMGSNMVLRLLAGGHQCVAYDPDPSSVSAELSESGARVTDSLDVFFEDFAPPRPVWIMVPDTVVDQVIEEITPYLQAGDIIIDGGNTFFPEDLRRAESLQALGIEYLDVGTSGGVWGRERGYCLMIGGRSATVERLDPVFQTLSPEADSVPATPGRGEGSSTAHRGYLHCGGHGAGHFVKMIHNGIEYGMMAAYAEGFAMLDKARPDQAENPSPVELQVKPGEIAELWRRGSVVGSWLLDLAAGSLLRDSDLQQFSAPPRNPTRGR